MIPFLFCHLAVTIWKYHGLFLFAELLELNLGGEVTRQPLARDSLPRHQLGNAGRRTTAVGCAGVPLQ
jgi:hypothetical protein